MVQASIACAVKHALRSPEHNAQETSISTNTVMMIPAASLDHIIIHRSRVYALDIGQCILIYSAIMYANNGFQPGQSVPDIQLSLALHRVAISVKGSLLLISKSSPSSSRKPLTYSTYSA